MLTIIQQLCSMKQKRTKYTQINTNKSMHSEMGPVQQNPIQRTVRTAHLSVLTATIKRYVKFFIFISRLFWFNLLTLVIPGGCPSVMEARHSH